ncbi:MAG: hypothetical protein H6667_05295 [Ardenticatenaceae bacterium]|nr:hypothetical protein [Ardenticatenaceae bacterium]
MEKPHNFFQHRFAGHLIAAWLHSGYNVDHRNPVQTANLREPASWMSRNNQTNHAQQAANRLRLPLPFTRKGIM